MSGRMDKAGSAREDVAVQGPGGSPMGIERGMKRYRALPERVTVYTDGDGKQVYVSRTPPKLTPTMFSEDSEYVRADVHAGAVDRVDELEAELKLAREIIRVNGWPDFATPTTTNR